MYSAALSSLKSRVVVRSAFDRADDVKWRDGTSESADAIQDAGSSGEHKPNGGGIDCRAAKTATPAAKSTHETESTMEAAEEEVLAANERFYAAYRSCDMELMAQCWYQHDDATCVHTARPLLISWDQVQQSWAEIFDAAIGESGNGPGLRIFPRQVRVSVSPPSGDACAAFVTAIEEICVDDDYRQDDNDDAMSATCGEVDDAKLDGDRFQMVATNIFIKHDDKWLLHHHHSSSILASTPRGF